MIEKESILKYLVRGREMLESKQDTEFTSMVTMLSSLDLTKR